MKKAVEESERNLRETKLAGIFIDGRKDFTLVLERNKKTRRYHKRRVRENHFTVTSEPDGSYVYHFTPAAATKGVKAAKQAALGLYAWLKSKGLDCSLELIGSDTTAEMSGKYCIHMITIYHLIHSSIICLIILRLRFIPYRQVTLAA